MHLGGHHTEVAIPVAYVNGKQQEPWKAFRLNTAVDTWDRPDGPGARIRWRPHRRRDLDHAGSGTLGRR